MTVPSAPRPAGFLVIAKDPLVVREVNDACRLGRIQNRLATVWDAREAADYLQRRGKHTDAMRVDLAWLDPDPLAAEEIAGLRKIADEKGTRIVVCDRGPAGAPGPEGLPRLTRPVDLPQVLRLLTSLEGFGLILVKVP